jgi:hypothetical protein
MTIEFVHMQAIIRAVQSEASPLDAEARHLMLTIALGYNFKTGECRFALKTLARMTGLGKTTIRDRMKKSVEAGCLDVSRKGARACYDFVPKMPPWADEVPPRKPLKGPPDVPPTPSKGSGSGPEQEEDSCLTKQNRATGAAARTLLRKFPEDIAALIAKLQQVPGKPGCAYERLIPKVLKAIDRCGQKAVEDLYALLAPEKGRLPPWRLYQMLDGLEAHSDRQAPPEPDPLPPDTPLIVEAKGLIEAAAPNIPARLRLEARLRAAEVDFKVMWWKEDMHKLAQALARTLAAERGIR